MSITHGDFSGIPEESYEGIGIRLSDKSRLGVYGWFFIGASVNKIILELTGLFLSTEQSRNIMIEPVGRMELSTKKIRLKFHKNIRDSCLVVSVNVIIMGVGVFFIGVQSRKFVTI